MDKIIAILRRYGFDSELDLDPNRAVLQTVEYCGNEKLNFFIQRDDLIHPVISGNKWRKLEGWIRHAKTLNKHTLVTFGGAYSNHLVATAAAGHILGFKTIGLLRGDEPMNNHYLDIAQAYGMDIIGVPRSKYREASALVDEYHALEGHLVIPEGGQGIFAFEGFDELVLSMKNRVDVIIHASATATTAVGLALAIKKYGLNIKVKSVLVLKNLEPQKQFALYYGVADLIEFIDGYHFGGYAKANSELLEFTNHFIDSTGIVVDPVYTAKCLWAYKDLYQENEFLGKRVAFLHTGGMLGRYSEKFDRKA